MSYIKQTVLVLCIGLALALTSCKSSPTSLLKAIPEDAAFVFAVRPWQLYTKGGLEKLENFKLYREVQRGLRYLDRETRELIEDLLKDPRSMGVDLEKAYLFGVLGLYDFSVGMVFKMNNLRTFDNKVPKILREAGFRVRDMNGYKVAEDYGFGVAWNKNMVVFGSGDFDEMFNPKGKTIADNPDFVNFDNSNFDAGIWASFQTLLGMVDRRILRETPMLEDMSDMNFQFFLNFDKNEINLSFEMTPEAKAKEYFEKYAVIKKDFDNKLLSVFPEKSYLTAKQSINIPEYVKIIASNNPYLDEKLIDHEVHSIINGLGGDILFSIFDFQQDNYQPKPLGGLAFTVKSMDVFDNLMGLIPEYIMYKRDEHYEMTLLRDMTFYFAFKNNIVFVTNDNNAITAFTGAGQNKSLSASAEMDKSSIYFYVDLDLDSYPTNIHRFLRNQLGSDIANLFNIMKPFKDLTLKAENDYKSTVSIRFKEGHHNTLQQILSQIDEMAYNSL